MYRLGEVFIEERNQSWNTPYLFNGKELDEETGLYYYGARYYNPRESIFLSVDPMFEETMTPYQYTYQNPIRFTDPTGMEGESTSEPTPKEAAAMAAHVYGDKKDDILIGGWKVSQRTFENVNLNDNDSGFKSQIYERTVEGKTEYVYATAGTEDGKDWKANALQAVGASKQHTISAKNAQEIASQLEKTGEELTFTGHSLGGGLAALNSNLTRNKAITFNAAGIGKATKLREGGITAALRTEGLIKAYIMTTDPLNNLQNNLSGIGPLMPDVNGKRHYIHPTSKASLINGHSMDNMLNEFGINAKKYAK